MATLFFSSLGLIILAVLTMFINVITGVSHSDFRNAQRVMIVHLLSLILYIFGILGTVGFGMAWIVQSLSK